jgi:hypothetical protein
MPVRFRPRFPTPPDAIDCRHRRHPGAQAARRTSRTCTRGAYWEGRSTASSWDFCVEINQCVGRTTTILISAQVDFYDRSVLGEGIHCLKCGSFVNLPRDGDPMVQCPYCAYRWCVRCKCPWHPNIKCSERADVEVEEWREAHGAQRCPGCFKIIEKDDPESCNHMTHKNTDVMPCTRERTDFCSCLCRNQFAATPARWHGSVGAPDSLVDFHTGYCCGVEISPDYPHAELDKLGSVQK